MVVARRKPAELSRAVLVDALDAAQRQRVTAIEARELADAELDASLDELRAVVIVLRRTGGYMAPGDQVALGAAKARLAAHGRSVEDVPALGRSTR